LPSQFYDPAKKTILYFPGWSGGNGGWTIKCGRITSKCRSTICPNQDLLVESWVADGWNVGFFYWDQLADESCTRDAEQKVWMDRGGAGLRWKYYMPWSNEYDFAFLKNYSSVAAICADTISTVMAGYVGPHVRFVGHSLGAQLATKCADMLHGQGHEAAPHRLALLEPFFTTVHLSLFHCSSLDLEPQVGEALPHMTASIVKSLWEAHHVATEVYKSSELTAARVGGMKNELLLGNPARQLDAFSTLVHYEPDWCGGLLPIGGFLDQFGHLECRHCAVFPFYFLQYGRSPPRLSAGEMILRTCPTPASSCLDTEIQELVERQHLVQGTQSWSQIGGRDTFDVGDDTFQLRGLGGFIPVETSTTTRTIVPTTTTTTTVTTARTKLEASSASDALVTWSVIGFAIAAICFVYYFLSLRRVNLRYSEFDSEDEYTPGSTRSTPRAVAQE